MELSTSLTLDLSHLVCAVTQPVVTGVIRLSVLCSARPERRNLTWVSSVSQTLGARQVPTESWLFEAKRSFATRVCMIRIR